MLGLFFAGGQDFAETLSIEIDQSDFFHENTRNLFLAIKGVIMDGGSVDGSSISAHAKLCGLDVISTLESAIQVGNGYNGNVELSGYLVDVLKRYSLLRKADSIKDSIDDLNAGLCVQEILQGIDSAVTGAIDDEKRVGVSKVGTDTEKRILERINSPVEIIGHKTGLNFFDHSFDGIIPSTLTFIGGRSGTGKSCLAQNLISNLAAGQEIPVLLFDTETSIKFVEDRLLTILSGFPYYDITHGRVSAEQIMPFVKILEKCPLYYYYMPEVNTNEIRLMTKKYKKIYGVEVFIVDFLGASDEERGHIKLGKSLKQIHDVAVEMDVGAVVMQQFSREQLDQNTGRNTKEVSLGHFAYSDMTTWYAENIAGIREPTTVEKSKYRCNRMIDIPKSRFSETGTSWPMNFIGEICRYESVDYFD